MAYQNQSSANVPAVHQLFYLADVRCGFEPIRVMKSVSHHADLCTLKAFPVSLKCEFAHFYLALFNKHYKYFTF